MLRRIFKSVLAGVVVALACFLFLRHFEQQSVFAPDKHFAGTPRSAGLDYEDVSLRIDDGVTVQGWFVPGAQPRRGTLLFLHGNAGNISHRVDKILFFHKMGWDVFILDYRGYGLSSGRPSEAGLYRDASVAYDHLDKTRDLSAPLVIFGESLGGAVAIDLAFTKGCDALIVEGTFTSMTEMARRLVPWVPSWALAYRFDSLSKIRQIDHPTLFIHSLNDEIVPFEYGKRLFEASGAPGKKLVILKGSHNDAFMAQEDALREEIEAFL